jgi:hypothetical protein
VIENRVLRRIFEPKREEVAEGWRRLHNEELHNLYTSSHIIRVIKSMRVRWAGHVARVGEMRIAYNTFLENVGRRPLGKPWRKWEDNTTMDIREIELGSVNLIHLAKDNDQKRARLNMGSFLTS